MPVDRPALPPVFEMDVTASGGNSMVTLSGELDGAAAQQLEPLSPGLSTNVRVLVDVGGLTFIDSMGLRVLVDWHQRISAAGGDLEIRAPSASLRRLLAVTSLDQVFTIVE